MGAQPARDFIGPPFPIGTLQPISGLIQLKSLDLSYCRELTGTAFVRAQPARDFIRSPFPIGTLDPISGLVELKQLNLYMCRNLTGTFCCAGTTTARSDWPAFSRHRGLSKSQPTLHGAKVTIYSLEEDDGTTKYADVLRELWQTRVLLTALCFSPDFFFWAVCFCCMPALLTFASLF